MFLKSFRYLCLKDYDLDPTYFVSTPTLAFEAMLKMTKVKTELLTDIDMVLMTEKAIRGGLTQVVRKHEIANNKYLATYDKTKKSVLLQYLDANNLYGYAMNQKLSLNGYEWADVSIVTDDFVKNYDANNDKGYLLEVDVEYPIEMHIAHEDLPFLSERKIKSTKSHSNYEFDEITRAHRKDYKTFNINPEPDSKLIASVRDKNKYVLHISTLKQALCHGLRLSKVYRVIEFNQSAWLKPYIDMNTNLRRMAKNDFEKNFFKLMNNSVFGKMIENVRKRREIKLIVSEERRKKLASEPNYALCTTFSDHLMAIKMRKTRIYMDKPILVGQAILDKSKELTYQFYYDYLKPKFKDKVNLMHMDTDSFVLSMESDDFFKDIKDDLKEWFDTSGYEKNRVLPDEFKKNASVNKKIIVKMKDELGKGHMSEFVAIAPKVYVYQQIHIANTLSADKKARGTNKSVTKKSLSFDLYKKCLFNNETVKCIQHRIKSTPSSIDTVKMNKIALKNYGNKRLRSFNGIPTYPYGTSAFKVCHEELIIKRALVSYLDTLKN